MSKRRGLGKGLGALIPNIDLGAAEKSFRETYQEININDIRPLKDQARQIFNEEKLEELAVSIKEHGVIQPVLVRPLSEGGYELVAGERRWRACLKLGYQVIPAVIKEYKDLEATAISLIENVQREDLNPLEEAEAYKKLVNEYGLTQEEVSGRVGKSRPFVTNMIRLLDLPVEIKNMLAEGQLNAGHARALLAIKSKNKQLAAAVKIRKEQLNVRQAEKIAKMLAHEKTGNRKNKKLLNKNFIAEIEAELNNYLGTTVKVKEINHGGGKIEINYKDEEELKRIIKSVLSR